MIRALVLALAMAGCSAVGDGGQDIRPPLTLTPDAEIEVATREAAAAWSAATGIPIAIGAGGVRVQVVDGLDACGRTSTLRRTSGRLIRVDRIEIRAEPRGDCMPWPATMRHELGHALQQWGSRDDFPPDPDGHSDQGLMSEKAGGGQIVDESALELVCAAAPCTAFAPE